MCTSFNQKKQCIPFELRTEDSLRVDLAALPVIIGTRNKTVTSTYPPSLLYTPKAACCKHL